MYSALRMLNLIARSPSGPASASVSARGNECSVSPSIVMRSPYVSIIRLRSIRATCVLICCPSIASTSASYAVGAQVGRKPVHVAHERLKMRIVERHRVERGYVGVRGEHAAHKTQRLFGVG